VFASPPRIFTPPASRIIYMIHAIAVVKIWPVEAAAPCAQRQFVWNLCALLVDAGQAPTGLFSPARVSGARNH
jgi:hypothetical protein